MGIASRSHCDKSMYSASVVDNAIYICSLLYQMIRQMKYRMAYQIRDLVVLGSSPEVGRCQFP